jgi:AcrR family transcriptional regulator
MTTKSEKSEKVDTPKKLDRRVVRTRQLLRDALMELILEKGYDAVTVQDITDRANLGRATLYVHFDDKDDLLLQSLTEIFDQLVTETGIQPVPMGMEAERPPLTLVIFRHAAQNKALYRVMFRASGATALVRRVRVYMADICRQIILSAIVPEKLPIPLEILVQHMVGSLIALLEWWLENDLPYPPETMSDMFRRLHLASMLAQFQAEQ